MSFSASVILPDSEPSWSLLRSLTSGRGPTVSSPAESAESLGGATIGLPATACRTIGLVLPTTDKTLLPAMIGAQLEKRGVNVETAPAPNFAFHILGQTALTTVVSVDTLANPFPDELCVNRAANYTSALRLMQLPPGELVLVEEQGLIVLAASHQGRLWHSHVIGTLEVPVEDLAREIEIAKMALDTVDGLGTCRAVTLVGERLSALKPALKKLIPYDVNTGAALLPNTSLKIDGFQKLLPESVREAQAARARHGLYARIGVLTALLYAIIFLFGWWFLGNLQAKVDVLRKEVSQTDGPASEVKETHRLWVQLSPAIDVQRYPVVQLSQITALMPPSGVLLKRFEAKPNEIDLRGDARDAQTATQFFDDLKKHPKLSRFNWSMPVPTVKDKVASFRIQGKLEGEG